MKEITATKSNVLPRRFFIGWAIFLILAVNLINRLFWLMLRFLSLIRGSQKFQLLNLSLPLCCTIFQ